MARARGRIGADRYPVAIRAGSHHLTADEGRALGGADAGPAPFELLAAALTACTAITLRMYADRKGWPVEALEVGVHYVRAGQDPARIERTLNITGALDETQKTRLLDIAGRTPVTLALIGGLPITTTLI